MEELTDIQKQKLDKLKKEAIKIGIKVGAISSLRIMAMVLVVIVINQLIVQNNIFVGIMSFISAQCGIFMMKSDLNETTEVLRKKVKEILDNN